MHLLGWDVSCRSDDEQISLVHRVEDFVKTADFLAGQVVKNVGIRLLHVDRVVLLEVVALEVDLVNHV